MAEQKHEGTTRRRFLKGALAGAAAAAATGGGSRSVGAATPSPEREKLESLVAKYGSELGDLRRTGEGS